MDVIDKELKRKQAIVMQKAMDNGLLDPTMVSEVIAQAKAEILTDITDISWDPTMLDVVEKESK